MNQSIDIVNLNGIIITEKNNSDIINNTSSDIAENERKFDLGINNWWAMFALMLVLGTAAGNILVCLAITWERRLQNVTNYFLMSLAITDLMVAILVMPLGILTLVRGYFPLPAIYCLVWICLDVLFCTASIMHLCTISVDRYLSLRYPMRFGRNKTRKRVILKILFVWLLSIAVSLPLCLMYSKDDDSVLVDGTCQIPDPLYKLIASIICFFIPLGVMLITYALTVKLLADKRDNLIDESDFNKRYIWKRKVVNKNSEGNSGTPIHTSGASTDTEFTILDTQDLWLPESDPSPPAISALHEFGAELFKLSRRLEGITNMCSGESSIPDTSKSIINQSTIISGDDFSDRSIGFAASGEIREAENRSASRMSANAGKIKTDKGLSSPLNCRRRASTYNETYLHRVNIERRSSSFHELKFEDKRKEQVEMIREMREPFFFFDKYNRNHQRSQNSIRTEINNSENTASCTESLVKNEETLFCAEAEQADKQFEISENVKTVVMWKDNAGKRRDLNIGNTKTLILPAKSMPLRRAATLRAHNCATNLTSKNNSTNTVISFTKKLSSPNRVNHSRTNSVISRNSSRHGRIIRLEQKATKVLGVVFFTFVILWAPFFVLNMTSVIYPNYEKEIHHNIFDFVTWLGYASSMVNPIFYTIFNKVFRQAFKKVLFCHYETRTLRQSN